MTELEKVMDEYNKVNIYGGCLLIPDGVPEKMKIIIAKEAIKHQKAVNRSQDAGHRRNKART